MPEPISTQLDPDVVAEIREELYSHTYRFRWDNGDGTITESDFRMLPVADWESLPDADSPLWATLRLGGERGLVVAIRAPVTG
jgi:hypothetical protein